MTEPRELHPALEQLERLFERDVAVLELLDDGVELGQSRFEILDRWIHIGEAKGEGLRPSPSHVAFQFPAIQCHAHAIARIDHCGIPDDVRAIRITAAGIPAPENGAAAEAPAAGGLRLSSRAWAVRGRASYLWCARVNAPAS